MSLTEKVKELQDTTLKRQSNDLSAALRKAEKLADLYADVKPNQYIVPIERLTGVPTPLRQTRRP